jgi:hypothetical protein
VNEDGIVKLVSVKDAGGKNIKVIDNFDRVLNSEQVNRFREREK